VGKASIRSSCAGVSASTSVTAALSRAGSAGEAEPLDHPRAGGDDPRQPVEIGGRQRAMADQALGAGRHAEQACVLVRGQELPA
jgi:hypothetical protein